jgi:hypothetical protein
VILADTSAWVEYDRATGSAADLLLRFRLYPFGSAADFEGAARIYLERMAGVIGIRLDNPQRTERSGFTPRRNGQALPGELVPGFLDRRTQAVVPGHRLAVHDHRAPGHVHVDPGHAGKRPDLGPYRAGAVVAGHPVHHQGAIFHVPKLSRAGRCRPRMSP